MTGSGISGNPKAPNVPTVLIELETVVIGGPEPGPGNSDGGPSDSSPSGEPPAGSFTYTFKVPVSALLHTSPEPGPGNSDGGGFDLASDR